MTAPHDHGVVTSVADAPPNILRELIQLSMSRVDLVSFAGGLPAEELFDVEGLEAATLAAMRSNTRAPWQYANTEGLPSLRERLAELCRQRAISASAGRMIVTSGSQQAIDVTTRVLVAPGDVVLVERPTFITALQTFRAAQAHLVGIDGDNDGPDAEAIEDAIRAARAEGRAVKLIYLVPSFSNPAGRVTSLARRHAILDIAARQGVTILEDDPYGELWFGKPPPPTLRALAEQAGLADHVIYVSSLSKTVSPGLRVGWVLLPETLMQPFRLVKSTADVHSSVLSQAVADAYLAQDRLGARIALARRSYAAKARAMADALAAAVPAIAFEPPPGGMFLWATLPEGCPAIAFARHALDTEGVAVVPGDPFYESQPETSRLRLSFSQGTHAGLSDGVSRIASAWRGWSR
jgi:2-aminoadipate transaminase